MEKTWKPTVAGILILIAVLISIVWPIIYYYVESNGYGIVVVFFVYIPAVFIIGIPAIIGSILALRRSSWVVVLICSMAACILDFVSGIAVADILYRISPPYDWFDPPWYIILFRDNSPLIGILFLLVGAIATSLIFLSKEEFE